MLATSKFNPPILEDGPGALGIAACIAFSPLLGPWYHKMGTNENELVKSLPGDDQAPHTNQETTRLIICYRQAYERTFGHVLICSGCSVTPPAS